MNFAALDDLVADFCNENNTNLEDLSFHMFPQTWGSTALGYGGWGGSAMTTSTTFIIYSVDEDVVWVTFGGSRVAYKIKNPNDLFWEDVRNSDLEPCNRHGKYISKSK